MTGFEIAIYSGVALGAAWICLRLVVLHRPADTDTRPHLSVRSAYRLDGSSVVRPFRD